MARFVKGHKTNLGRKHSEEIRARMSRAQLGVKLSEETKKKIGDKNRGKKRTLTGEYIKCKYCNKQVYFPKCKLKLKDKGKYCSEKCYWSSKRGISSNRKGIRLTDEHKKKLSIAHWQGGKSFEPYSLLFNRQIRDKVRVRDNFVCQVCGIPELECSKRLAVHHIDYDKKNTNIDNLISLCQSCHSQTNHNRRKWKETFQKVFITR